MGSLPGLHKANSNQSVKDRKKQSLNARKEETESSHWIPMAYGTWEAVIPIRYDVIGSGVRCIIGIYQKPWNHWVQRGPKQREERIPDHPGLFTNRWVDLADSKLIAKALTRRLQGVGVHYWWVKGLILKPADLRRQIFGQRFSQRVQNLHMNCTTSPTSIPLYTYSAYIWG